MEGTHWGREEEEVLSGVYNKIFLELYMRCVPHCPLQLCGSVPHTLLQGPGEAAGGSILVFSGTCLHRKPNSSSFCQSPDCLQAFVSRELSKLLDDQFVVTSYYPPSPIGCPKLEGGISYSIL